MSLTKLLMAPIKLFKKEVITFLIIRRYDLGINNEKLRYISVRPSASIFVLRQKVWHLLELPDYCEEVIILKSPGDIEIALTELRRGNDPQHPYFLEVWLPEKRCSTISLNNMLTYRRGDTSTDNGSAASIFEEKKDCHDKLCNVSECTMCAESVAVNKLRNPSDLLSFNLKKSNVSSKISRSSIFRPMGRKSQDNFTNLLLKIQNDLSTLSNKLSVLENKIST